MSQDRTDQSEDDVPTSPWTRPGFVLSAVFVGLLVIAGAWQLLWPAGGGSQDPPPAAATTTGAEDVTSDSACDLDPGDQQVPTSAPDTTWQALAGVPTPASESAGPGRTDPDGARWCFARSPWGATLAAANFFTAQFDYDRLPATLERSALAGQYRDQTAARLEDMDRDAFSVAVNPNRVLLAGFRVVSHDGATALVDLLVTDAGGRHLTVPVALVWVEGDWRIDMAATATASWTLVTDTTGYVLWGEA